MIRVGVAGCGKIAQVRHLPEYQEHPCAQVHGLYDLNPDRTRALAEQYHAKAYGTYEGMLADPQIYAVSICTANAVHAEMAIAALNAGKHVYIEKPVALNFEDLKKIREAVIANPKQKVCVGFELRYCQQLKMLMSILDQGRIGEVH